MTDHAPTRISIWEDVPVEGGTMTSTALTSTTHTLVHTAPSVAALDVALAAWLDAKANKSGSAKTKRAYDDTLRAFRTQLQDSGRDLDADPRAVALAVQGWAGHDEPAPATFNQRLAILSSFYAFARKRGLITGENPIALVDRRTVHEYAQAHPIDPADLKRRVQQIDRTTLAGARDYALLAILSQTGRRLAEVAALRWADLHVADNRVTLTVQRAKGGKVMRDKLNAAISRALMTWLHQYYGHEIGDLASDAPIWISLARNSHGKPLSTRSISTICKERLGVSKVHALRHTFAHVMEDAGAKVSDIQAHLGHASLATTGRYLAALRRAENIHADEIARRMGFDDE
jgi:site-specific recombinase XerD